MTRLMNKDYHQYITHVTSLVTSELNFEFPLSKALTLIHISCLDVVVSCHVANQFTGNIF